MGLVKRLLLGLVLAEGVNLLWALDNETTLPYIDPDPWWGPGEPQAEDTTIRQFSIDVPEADVDDLKERLAVPLRLTPTLEGANFTYGFDAATLEAIVEHWRTEYDWKEREPRFNTYPHFKTQIEGLDIHFMRAAAEAAPNVTVLPLLLVHGWPGSFVEFLNILPLLTTEQEGSGVAFEVICPSLPGFTFSQASAKQGLGTMQTAQIFLKLMKRLGYEEFYVQGGDWGSVVVSSMATMYPENVLGMHINLVQAIGNKIGGLQILLGAVLQPGLLVAPEDQHKLYPLSEKINFLMAGTGYFHLQSTKPDTIGAALNQHPASLAEYILEKFSFWTHPDNQYQPDGGLLQPDFPIPLDEMLDDICLYWFTGSITSSMRFYAEHMPRFFELTLDNIPCVVPAGLAVFPQEFLQEPKNIMAHKFHDIVTYSDLPAGGHFAAMERPELLAADVHIFVREARRRQ